MCGGGWSWDLETNRCDSRQLELQQIKTTLQDPEDKTAELSQALRDKTQGEKTPQCLIYK